MRVNGKKLSIISKFRKTIYLSKTIVFGIGHIVNILKV